MPNSKRRQFGELERTVLDVLWDHDDDWLTVRQIHELVESERGGGAYTTVMTVLDRMAKKGVVEQERQGRAFLYRAAAGRAEMTADLMRGPLDEVSGEDRAQALVAFVGAASPAEVAALREALGRLES